VPFVKHLLVPLQYTYRATGHLPSYLDAFTIPPSYYYPFLPSSQVIFLDLGVYAERVLPSIRLAHDQRDMKVSSGARVSAKRYLHVAGFELRAGDKVAPEWRGLITLEADGTAEGKTELERRLMNGGCSPWEIVWDKSMAGNVWLRLIKES
jgi:hypothetical protein